MSKHKRTPYLGSQFDSHQRSLVENVQAYCDVLAYFRPRGFSKLTKEGAALIATMCKAQRMDDAEKGNAIEGEATEAAGELMRDCDEMLTAWARRVERHDYIAFGPFEHNGDVGFYISTESAIEEADLQIDAGDEIPRGFSGLLVEVSDHGNVTASHYSRGRKTRELFAVV